jgi:hypothetical protein
LFLGIILVTTGFALADPGVIRLDFGSGIQLINAPIDQCQSNNYLDANGQIYDMKISSNCSANVEIAYPDEMNLVLGPVIADEVQTGQNWVYVDSVARPDLDVPAVLTFTNHGFVIRPVPERNGVPCEGNACNTTYFDKDIARLSVDGFSNYSLTFAQDFTVYSDAKPELKTKTYQTIDLGDLKRNTTYACVVQIFGRNEISDWVLVQTNPTREVQARMFGSPDLNQPESLGYFPTVNGMANTYFRGDSLAGYNDFQLVIQCASGTEKLVYEEPISTRYSPLGRNAVARGVWLTDGSNGFYAVIYFFGGLIVLWIVVMIFRRTFRRY